jgi:hypothetical protein
MVKLEEVRIAMEAPARLIAPASGYVARVPSVPDEIIFTRGDGQRFRLTRPFVRDADGNLWVDLEGAEPLPPEPHDPTRFDDDEKGDE